MTITAVSLVDDNYSDRVESGHLKVQFTQTYELTTDDATDSTIDAGSHPSLPARGSELVTSNGFAVWVQSVSARRVDRLKFAATVTYTNDTENWPLNNQGLPEDDPEQVAPEIDITSEEIQVPIDEGFFVGVYDQDGNLWNEAANGPGPEWMQGDGPITNTALQQVERFKAVYRDVIRYTDWKRDWSADWDDFVNTLNDDDVTFTQSDGDGVRMTKTYKKRHLLCQSVTATNVWKKGQLWFRRTIIFRSDADDWLLKIPDVGTVKYDNANDAFDELRSQNESALVNTPVPLNGNGDLLWVPVGGVTAADDQRFFVYYKIYPDADHQELIDG